MFSNPKFKDVSEISRALEYCRTPILISKFVTCMHKLGATDITRADTPVCWMQRHINFWWNSLVVEGSRFQPQLKFLFAHVCLILGTVKIRVNTVRFDVQLTLCDKLFCIKFKVNFMLVLSKTIGLLGLQPHAPLWDASLPLSLL